MKRILFSLLLLLAIVALPHAGWSQVLTYNQASDESWEATDAWLDGATPSDWVEDASAVFNTSTGNTFVVSIGTDHSLAGLSNTGIDQVNLTSTPNVLLTFGGGTIQTDSNVRLENNVNLTGDFAKTGSAQLVLNDNLSVNSHSGTITINAGTVNVNRNPTVSTNTHVVVNNSGTFQVGQNAGSTSIGNLTLNAGGSAFIGLNNSSPSLTVASLSGQSGSVIGTNSSGTSQNRGLTVAQSVDTTYGGNVIGNDGSNTTTFEKSGIGALTIDGSFGAAGQAFQTTSTVSGGALYLNHATNNIGDGTAGTAMEVTGGILGGAGTLTATGGDDVVVNGTGQLAAGTDGTTGQLTFSLTGGELDLTGIGGAALLFDLGADASAGTDYDQIRLTAGTLALDTLEFGDFSFTTLAGFGAGNVYTLFSTSGIAGGLGTTTSGLVGGLAGTLSISGNDLLLTVVPEPHSMLLLATGLLVLAVIVWRRPRTA